MHTLNPSLRFTSLVNTALRVIACLTACLITFEATAGLILNTENGATPDEAEIKKVTDAANGGDSDAALSLGQAYAAGTGVPADAQKAEKWLMDAIKLGNDKAGTRLGVLYLETSDQGKDVERATKGLEILRAGAEESADSNITLGLLHLSGTFVPTNFDSAGTHFRKAADMGDMNGWFYLGQMHSGDLGFEDRIEPKKALEYLNTSFEAGNFDAGRILVKMLREGKRVQKDEKRAFDVVKRAADDGNSKAYEFLGELYEAGSGVEADQVKARESYLAAAQAGLASAQNKLGLIYGEGTGGVAKNQDESRKWFEAAANQGLPLSHYNLALLLDTKENPTRQDEKLAADHLIAAASAGIDGAQDRLGSWYRDGRHVSKDIAAASTWFKAAAGSGNLSSKINLAQLLEATAQEAKALQSALQLYADTANAGHPVGHFHFARMLLSGRLGRIDPINAYAHLAIAAEAGFPLAADSLPQLAANLNEEQIAAAEKIKSGLKSYKWQ